MIPITSSGTTKLARALTAYEPRATIARVAGLLTAPHLQANTLRLELLVHLAVAHCAGKKRPSDIEIGRWLNRYLGKTQLAKLEDPAEDVFVTNVETPGGNCRIFEGIWESNDYFLQIALDTLMSYEAPQACRDLLGPAFALLRLSECVAERLDLPRWHTEPSNAHGLVRVGTETDVAERELAVTFTGEDLERLGVSRETLAPFVIGDEEKAALVDQWTGHSSLERSPIVDFGDVLVLTLPPAVSPAIRRFVMSELRRTGYLQGFGDHLGAFQAHQVESTGLREVKNEAVPIPSPPPDDLPMPSIHAWLLRYDGNKYLHVVLLQDRLEWADEQGLDSVVQYPESYRKNLERYIDKVAEHCQTRPDFMAGMTLVVVGGIGRGFGLAFPDWPDEWSLSSIGISDLVMLAGDPDQPLKHYMKCMKQKEVAEENGVYFQNLNGDFNFYCYWRDRRYQLIPRFASVGSTTKISVGNDFVAPFRQQTRNLLDQHVVRTLSGSFAQVMRLARDSHFQSLRDRPIYASLDHLRQGMLAGVTETPRGPSWLMVDADRGDEVVSRLLFDMWFGFLGLYDRVVTEVERLVDCRSHEPLEVRLNFRALDVTYAYKPIEVTGPIPDPEVRIDLDVRSAEIIFPSDFLAHFQRAENRGEALVIRAITRSLIGLHNDIDADAEERLLNLVQEEVVPDAGMRLLHLVVARSPVEYLLARQEYGDISFPHEDFVFAKLQISDGCVAEAQETALTTKSECNDFLHKVVGKVWGLLRDRLREFDRASVIRKALAVQEAAIEDRDHWRRTAQAVIALYSRDEDVYAIAQEREKARSQLGLTARVVSEIAICECPALGGREVSAWELDELLAKVGLFIEIATDSDAIHSDLIRPTVELHANGEYTVDRSFQEHVIRPFITKYFREEYETAAGAYEELYRGERLALRVPVDQIYSSEFLDAFAVEFRLSLEGAFEGFAELFEIALECGDAVVETTLGVIRRRLMERRRLSSDEYGAFLAAFGIFHRPAWDQLPAGFKRKDLHPWRYRRRLSAVVRPLLVFGDGDRDVVLYGVGAIRQGFGYLIERMESGQLPVEFFTTAAMRRYIGAVNHERGHAFAKSVAEQLRQDGWQASNEVQMTELGVDRELADGDIDVLAWKPSGEVLLIECKRLQLARTVAEIAEICRRFRGESKDDLDKHVRRVKWVMQNPSSLRRIVGFEPDPGRIDHRLVTNTHVPMMYLTSLPIEAERIGPLRRPL